MTETKQEKVNKLPEILLAKAAKYAPNRFTGRRVGVSSKKQAQTKNREKRLNKFGYTLLMFQS